MLIFIIINALASGNDSLRAGLDSVYYRYQPVAAESLALDSFGKWQITAAMPDTSSSLLLIRGVKDFSYDLQEGFDQGLEMNVRGTIASTEIEGNLSDQSVTGPTTRITDIEKVHLTAAGRHIDGGLGTLTIDLPFGIVDEIQGGRIGFHDTARDNRAAAAYALNRGTFRRVEFQGEEGKQSPYIVPGEMLPASERVYCGQGMMPPLLLVRDESYMVNYDQSIISFTNQVIITARTRIIVEFLDATQDWSNVYQEADAATGVGGTAVQALVRRTYDDRAEPLAFTLSEAERESLAVVGDSARVRHVYADTSSDGAYRLEGGHFVYYGPGSGAYRVSFFYAGENAGDYVYDPVLKGFVYTGPGAGNYTPARLLALPSDHRFYAVGVTTAFGLEGSYLGSDVDRNTYSSWDDQDNRAYGWRIGVRRKVSFLTGRARYLKYGPDLALPAGREELDYQYAWDTQEILTEEGQLGAEAVIRPGLTMKADYGILNRQRQRWSAEIRPWFMSAGYGRVDTVDAWFVAGQRTWHRLGADIRYENREQVHFTTYDIRWPVNANWRLGLSGDYERREDRGLTARFDIVTAPVEVSLGRRQYGDSTYLFGVAAVRLAMGGFSFLANIQQRQAYAQKRDDYYEPVSSGTGDYVYDSLTDTYRPKPGGDYVKRTILLKDFQRVVDREYGGDIGFRRDKYEVRGRWSVMDQPDLLQHTEDITGSWTADDAALELSGLQSLLRDRRYVLAPSDIRERSLAARPRYGRGNLTIAARDHRETWGGLERETRSEYAVEAGYELGRKLYLQPKIGYAYVILASAYFTGLDLDLQIPRTGVTIGYPLFGRGRTEVGGELVYRRFSVTDVPYFFAAVDPPGLTTIASVTAGFSVSGATVLNLSYRAEFPPSGSVLHNFKLNTRIAF